MASAGLRNSSAPHPANNLTADFRSLVAKADPQAENAARWARARAQTRSGGSRAASAEQQQALARRRTGEVAWIREALSIEQTTRQLLRFLTAIRRPYLSLSLKQAATTSSVALQDEQDAGGSADPSASSPSGGDKTEQDLFARWKNVRQLTDAERDEVDLQTRMVVKKCIDRVQELEKAEEIRQRTSHTAGTSALSLLVRLSSSSSSSTAKLASEQLAQHRAAITSYLSRLLAEASNRARDMQERRLVEVKRIQRTRMGARAAATVDSTATASSGGILQSLVGGSSAGSNSKAAPITGTIGAAYDPALSLDTASASSNGQGTDILKTLSPAQIQLFESEESALINSLQSDLNAVLAAERKISDISELQTTLIQHLGEQSEAMNSLLGEAVDFRLEVGRGNEQLQKAKERNRSANKFLSLFLVGSGLGLLFLHWVD
ncbi:unnamed protein product [Tilletia controversa]|uniref:SNARE-complex protein Syntaxin-18 N-terminal domain-containing protein n=3 Tax=Tilletia TaxID=13289 RepID=A0A8X7MVZ6_9BASI|nr:hypothetical protein CF328_g7189 [Tilletia controversa]KAE8187784.1 hypothetical protein CF335_g7072 [Tilletia laevis]KAE8248314.1 hypothetical protein A4X03_0g6813 [Tilletia caries]KAE8196368.1 hypothetical protein CF336_g2651 [Tilletia laevis]KAE8249673.1 hypothetical protein A4X06_0g3120 [Tilletia controversa]